MTLEDLIDDFVSGISLLAFSILAYLLLFDFNNSVITTISKIGGVVFILYLLSQNIDFKGGKQNGRRHNSKR